MFLERLSLQKTIKNISSSFKVLLLTGPRQVGKSTILKHCAPEGYRYITLDDLDTRELALRDPALFFQKYPPPLIIDEIQYAPNLLTQIKIIVDQQDNNGIFWITGSQKFSLMEGVSESLAGRVGIIELSGLALSERLFAGQEPVYPLEVDGPWFENLCMREKKHLSIMAVYDLIWRGSFPLVALNPEVNRDIFYESYIQTYLSRDLRQIISISNEVTFYRFMRALAARTSQLLNYSEVAKELQIDLKTVKSWVSVLERCGIIVLLEPYFTNLTSRLIKTPKIYFMDTGLCCYLTRWSSSSVLEAGAMSGAILETFVITEIIKGFSMNGRRPLLSFYRDKDKNEVALLVEYGDTLLPIEIKKSATPSMHVLKNIDFIKKLHKKIDKRLVFCLRQDSIPLSSDVIAIPLQCL